MSKRFAAIFAALIMIFGSFALSPASAAQSVSVAPAAVSSVDVVPMAWNACPDGRMCFWENTNYWGTTWFPNAVWSVCLGSPTWVSSIRNRTGTEVLLWKNDTCSGTPFVVQPGQSFASMPGQIGNDALRTFRIVP